MSDLIRCAVYIRVSSDEQAKYGDSLRDQRERCTEYVNTHSNMVLQDVYIDDGVSGQKLERGAFERLMDAVKSDSIDLILFTKLDRWFRNLRHYLNTQALLETHNVAWTAIDQAYFDTSSPHGRAFVAQSMMWAELEAQNDGVRIRDVFRNKVKYGEVITGKIPRGFQIENKHLMLSHEAPIIYDSCLYFLKTQSLHATVRYLQDQYGISMTLNNLKTSILRNEKYVGKYRDNDAYCPRILSDEEFLQIQKILEGNRNVKAGQKYPYIFSGLLTCGECGHRLSGCHINAVSTRQNGQRIRYQYPAYECKQSTTNKKCPNRGKIRELWVEENILEPILAELKKYTAAYTPMEKDAINNRSQKASIRKKLARLKELYLHGIISLEEYQLDRLSYTSQLDNLADITEAHADFSNLHPFLNGAPSFLYASFTNPEKRRFWRSAVKEIHISKSENRIREYKIFY